MVSEEAWGGGKLCWRKYVTEGGLYEYKVKLLSRSSLSVLGDSGKEWERSVTCSSRYCLLPFLSSAIMNS